MIFPWFYKILREAHQPLRIEIKTKIPNFHEQKNPFSCPRRDFFGHYLVTCISHASNLPKTVQQEHYEPYIKLHDCSLPTSSGLMLTWTFTLLLRNVPSVVPCCKNNISNLSWATRAFYTARHAKGINFISCWQNSLESLFLYFMTRNEKQLTTLDAVWICFGARVLFHRNSKFIPLWFFV